MRAVAVLLLLWEPLNLAIAALTVLPTITYRGWLPALELTAHAAVAALAVAGGFALLNRTASARPLALAAIGASFGRTLQSIYASALPRQVPPGQESILTAGAVTLAALAAVIVVRGRPVEPPCR